MEKQWENKWKIEGKTNGESNGKQIGKQRKNKGKTKETTMETQRENIWKTNEKQRKTKAKHTELCCTFFIAGVQNFDGGPFLR